MVYKGVSGIRGRVLGDESYFDLRIDCGDEMNSSSALAYFYAPSACSTKASFGGVILMVCLCGGSSQAEPLLAAASDAGIPDIVVTANKRPELIGEIPTSILVISEEALERANVQTFNDLIRVSPGLTISTPSQPANNSINIRGIGTYAYSIATQPSVAVIVDGIAQPFQAQAFTALTDVKQVEVIRGPQSTLFGKSATAGVINITTRGPGDEPAADAEVSIATDHQETVRASVTSPITDTLKFRLSGNFLGYRGNLDNISTGHWEDGDLSESWRGNLMWTPNEYWTLTLLPYLYSDHGTCCAQANTFVSPGVTFSKNRLTDSPILYGAEPSADNIKVANTVDAKGDAYDAGSGLKVVRQLAGGLTLANIASYDHYTLHDNQSTDATDFNFASIAPGAPVGGSANGGYFTVNSITEELTVASGSAQSLRYIAGLYFTKSAAKRDFVRGSDSLGTFGTSASGLPILSLPTTNSTQYSSYVAHSDIKTSAAYGQLDYEVSRDLTLTGGLRLHHEDVSYNLADRLDNVSFGSPHCSAVNPYSVSNPGTTLQAPTCNSSTNLLGKAAISLRVLPGLMVFADFSQGFKGLAYDLTSTMALQTPVATGPYKGVPIGDVVASRQPVAPEKSVDYEIGLKGDLLQQRLVWNLTSFYEEFRGFQAQYRDGFTNQNILESIGKVSSYGIESEMALRPIPQMTLTLNGVYDIAKMISFPTGPCYPNQPVDSGCVNGMQNLNDKPLPNAPKGSVNVDANYGFALAGHLSALIDLSYRWQSQVIFALNQDPNSTQADYGIFNIASSIVAANWKLTLFCTNVLDQHYAINRMTASQFNISPDAAPFTTATYWTPGRDAFRYGGIKLAVNF